MSKEKGNFSLQSLSKKEQTLIKSLKEILNVEEEEIYYALKECNQDPNAAVDLLYGQASFVKVKSKREKKKERAAAKFRPLRFTTDTAGSSSMNDGSRVSRPGTSQNEHILKVEDWPFLKKIAVQESTVEQPKPSSDIIAREDDKATKFFASLLSFLDDKAEDPAGTSVSSQQLQLEKGGSASVTNSQPRPQLQYQKILHEMQNELFYLRNEVIRLRNEVQLLQNEVLQLNEQLVDQKIKNLPQSI